MFDQAIFLDSNNYLAYINRAIVRLKLDDTEGAINDFTQALVINSNCEDIKQTLALLSQAQF